MLRQDPALVRRFMEIPAKPRRIERGDRCLRKRSYVAPQFPEQKEIQQARIRPVFLLLPALIFATKLLNHPIATASPPEQGFPALFLINQVAIPFFPELLRSLSIVLLSLLVIPSNYAQWIMVSLYTFEPVLVSSPHINSTHFMNCLHIICLLLSLKLLSAASRIRAYAFASIAMLLSSLCAYLRSECIWTIAIVTAAVAIYMFRRKDPLPAILLGIPLALFMLIPIPAVDFSVLRFDSMMASQIALSIIANIMGRFSSYSVVLIIMTIVSLCIPLASTFGADHLTHLLCVNQLIVATTLPLSSSRNLSAVIVPLLALVLYIIPYILPRILDE